MERFKSELGYAYGSQYAFGYTEYCRLAEGESAAPAYESGFLPYSTNPDIQNLFYMARSVRVPVAAWAASSENRRILRKFEEQFAGEPLTQEQLKQDSSFRTSFLEYFSRQHGEDVMSAARLEGILATPLPLQGTRYTDTVTGTLAGFVLAVALPDALHYWYSCYEEAYIHSSLGMWLMLDTAQRAKEAGIAHLYLGTAYGEKGRYKTNFSPLEFWDGSTWNTDEKLLARYIKEDGTRRVPFTDRFNAP